MSRFDYVKYDPKAMDSQAYFKGVFDILDEKLKAHKDGRAKALALTALEEAYMWIGKAIRDDQISRNGSAELQEGRGNE